MEQVFLFAYVAHWLTGRSPAGNTTRHLHVSTQEREATGLLTSARRYNTEFGYADVCCILAFAPRKRHRSLMICAPINHYFDYMTEICKTEKPFYVGRFFVLARTKQKIVWLVNFQSASSQPMQSLANSRAISGSSSLRMSMLQR
jgi:hypothetical protein